MLIINFLHFFNVLVIKNLLNLKDLVNLFLDMTNKRIF